MFLTTKQIRKMIKKGEAVPQEDLEIFLENEEARKNYAPDGIRNLYAAICHQGVVDYKSARKTIGKVDPRSNTFDNAQKTIDECEGFFGTEFFKGVTGVHDRDRIIHAIEEQMKAEARRTLVV